MLDVLSKLIGPHRAVSVYAFLHTRGAALVAAVLFAAILGGLLLFGKGEEPHEHEAFLTLEVLSLTALNGDLRNGALVSVRLPDGHATSITSTEGPVAASVTTTACVEKRVYVTSGEARYRLKLPQYCGGQ